MYCIAKIRMAKKTTSVQTKTGTRMETGFGFVDIEGKNGLPVSLVAFGSLADELAKYGKGSLLRISGTFRANDYTTKAGEEVHSYRLTVEGIAGINSPKAKHQPPANHAQQPGLDL